MLTLSVALILGAGFGSGDDEKITTGPPAFGPPSIDRDRHPGLGRTHQGPADGPGDGDIRVNVETFGAQNETSFAINPLDESNWVGVANDYRNGGWETGWYSTLDGGASFTSGTFGILGGFGFSGDACVTFTPNGTCHVVCMMYSGPGGEQVTGFRSLDGGLTWSSAHSIDLGPNDKPQIDADHSGGAHHGDVTTAWMHLDGDVHTYVSTTSDDGVSWSAGLQISDDTSPKSMGPDVAYGDDSRLHVMWADRKSKEIHADVSADGGVSWGKDKFVTAFTHVPTLPGSKFRVFDIFSMAADWTDGPYSGNVYIAYHDWDEGAQDADVKCATSSDGGHTWSINNVGVGKNISESDQVFPGIDTDPQGNVHVAFFDRRLDQHNHLLWTWVARSSNGGASWQNHQASDRGWDHLFTEFRGFIGDYIDVECSTHRVMPFWPDGRRFNSQDVYTDSLRLDLHTDVDDISAAAGGQANFTLSAGPNHGGWPYFLLGSFTGTDPGITLGNGIHLPLNYDFFTVLTLTQANGAVFQNFRGTLDADGGAAATLDTLGPFDPVAAGLDLDFAFVVLTTEPVYGSNATRVSLVQ